MICINWGVGRNHRVDKGITLVITRKVSPPEPLALVGDPFFCEWFSENGKRMLDSRHLDIVFSAANPRNPLFAGAFLVPVLYQLGNWKAGKTCSSVCWHVYQLYQLGNWKAGKTTSMMYYISPKLYQLGNWKAGKTPEGIEPRTIELYQLGNWKAGKTSRAFCVLTR